MKKWFVLVLFLVGMFFDGIIFPVFFGFRESFLTIFFLIMMILYYKADFHVLIIGVVFCRLAEFYWGLKLGVLILPLLISVGTFFLLNNFFNFRSRVLVIFSGAIMFFIFWISSVLVNKIL